MRMLKIFGVSRCPVSGDNTQPHLGQSRVVVKEEGGHKSQVQVVYSTGVRGWGVVKREGADYLCWEEHDWRRLSPRLIGHPHSNTCYTSTTWMSPPSLVWWVTLHPTHTHSCNLYHHHRTHGNDTGCDASRWDICESGLEENSGERSLP